ncbi:hypothetical protein A2J03_24990 [Rhodococcus sp. EPR-157]|uniref:phosphatase PAP2 family protein n=1 Tax=Rhodococcus sp. EPR-157 TaxID=1813677 RepID=UPI0007BB570B|nr:hypothetical protein A2J03_24990 [Rhodococcus sp. EPR-157]
MRGGSSWHSARSACSRTSFTKAHPVTIGAVASSDAATEAGIRFHDRISTHRTGWATVLAEVATDCAQPVVGVVVAIGVAAWFFRTGRRVDAVRALAVMAGTLVVSTIAKYVIREPRPPQRLWLMSPDTVWSFPSGHTAVAAAHRPGRRSGAAGRPHSVGVVRARGRYLPALPRRALPDRRRGTRSTSLLASSRCGPSCRSLRSGTW